MIQQYAQRIRTSTKRGGIGVSTEKLEHEVSCIRQQEQSMAFAALQQPLEDAALLLSHTVDEVTTDDCDEVGTVFQEVQHVVQGAIATFEERDLAPGVRPYPLLLKLWSLHRELVEAQVLVGNVRGLCESGRLATDFTGSYGHLRQYLKKVIRGRRELLALLGVEAVPSAQGSVRTETSGQHAATA